MNRRLQTILTTLRVWLGWNGGPPLTPPHGWLLLTPSRVAVPANAGAAGKGSPAR